MIINNQSASHSVKATKQYVILGKLEQIPGKESSGGNGFLYHYRKFLDQRVKLKKKSRKTKVTVF